MSNQTWLTVFLLLWLWFTIALGSTLEHVGLSKSRVGSIVVPLNFMGLIAIILVARRLGI